MVMFHAPDLPARATCSDPAHLPLVDEAYRRPGGPAGQQMRDQLCARCPIQELCLDEAMAHGEWGIWGGSSPYSRTQHGGTKPRIAHVA